MAADQAGSRYQRLRAILVPAVVAAPVTFNLWTLAAERLPVQNLNDADVHLQMIRWAERRITSGNTPMDGWFAGFGLGSSHFHHYQSLSHIICGALAVPFNAQDVFAWSLYVLVAFWPLCMYWTTRLFGRPPLEAACVALVSPVIASAVWLGYEHAAYVWRGYGVWSQLWAMWSLPLTLGMTWQAVTRGRHAALAALGVAATCGFHLTTAYLAFVWIGILLLAMPRDWRVRTRRGITIAVAGLIGASWLLVPFLVDLRWASASEFARGQSELESYGAKKVMSWLVTGELFDAGHLPVLTVLLAIGLVVSALRWHRDEWSRTIVIAFLATLMLYFGRPTFGFILRFVPGLSDAPMERFVLGVHLTGALLAGVGLCALCVAIVGVARRVRLSNGAAIAACAAAVVVVLCAPYLQRYRFNMRGASSIRAQLHADSTDGRDAIQLIERAKSTANARIYAGLRANWGADYKVGAAPMFSILANEDADAVGFTFRTLSLSNNVEARFDETNPAHYDLFNVGYLLMPAGRRPPVPASRVAAAGRHVLWEVETEGYLEVVDTTGTLEADRTDIGRTVEPFLHSEGPRRDRYPTIAFDGLPAARPTSTGPESGAAGRVNQQSFDRVEGRFTAVVTASRRAVVLAKASFDPRWEAAVDGRRVDPQLVAPSFVGVPVEPGTHEVELFYRPFPYHLPLLLIGALAIFATGYRRSPIAIRADGRAATTGLRDDSRSPAQPPEPAR